MDYSNFLEKFLTGYVDLCISSGVVEFTNRDAALDILSASCEMFADLMIVRDSSSDRESFFQYLYDCSNQLPNVNSRSIVQAFLRKYAMK